MLNSHVGKKPMWGKAHVGKNSVDPDQLASEEFTLFSIKCILGSILFFESLYMLIVTV